MDLGAFYNSQLNTYIKEVRSQDWTSPSPAPKKEDAHAFSLRKSDRPLRNDQASEPMSLETMRHHMMYDLKQYIATPEKDDTGSLRVYQIMAGGGKTHAGVQVAQWATHSLDYKMLWAAPRHNSMEDIRGVDGFDGSLWYHWLPMQKGSDTKVETCRYFHQQQEWMRRGYPSIELCRGVCGIDQHIKSCLYRTQKKQKHPIFFVRHPHLAFGIQRKDWDACIIDELPLQSFVEHRMLTVADVESVLGHADDIGKDLWNLRALLQAIVKLMTDYTYWDEHSAPLEGKELYDKIGNLADQVMDEIEYREEAQPLVPLVTDPDQVHDVPTYFVQSMIKAMSTAVQAWRNDWHGWVDRVWITKDRLHLLDRRNEWEHLPSKMVVLDATGKASVYRQLFPERMVSTFSPAVERAGEIIQVVGRLYGISTMTNEEDETPQQARDAVALVEHYKRLHPDKKIGVITHKSAVTPFRNLLGSENVGWFYALRGSNTMETVETLFVIGSPAPRIDDVLRTATALDPDRTIPYGRREEGRLILPFSHTEKEYRVTKEFYNEFGGIPVRNVRGFDQSPELNAIYEQLREAEIVQAIHRSRVNVRECTVFLLTSTPTDEVLDGVYDTPPHVMGFPDVVNWQRWLDLSPHLDEVKGKEVTVEQLETWVVDKLKEVNPDKTITQAWARRAQWALHIVKFFGVEIEERRPPSKRGRTSYSEMYVKL